MSRPGPLGHHLKKEKACLYNSRKLIKYVISNVIIIITVISYRYNFLTKKKGGGGGGGINFHFISINQYYF